MLKMIVATTFLALALLGTCSAQKFSLGRCNSKLTTVTNFDPSAYAGKWYEYSRSPLIFEALGKCITATYTPKDDETIEVVNKQKNIFGYTQSAEAIAYAESVTDLSAGKLKVKFKNTVSFPFAAPYWVLATDYTQYAVVYSCTNSPLIGKFQNAWILTRDRIPLKNVTNEAKEVLRNSKIKLRLDKTKQSCKDV